jgi:DNA-binding SARP family transcriptional activator
MFGGRLVELRTQKASAVLSYLALTEAKHESRERLVGLLWSRSEEEKARASLRQVVRELRTAFEGAGYEGFSAGRLSIYLSAEKVEVDIESIIRLAESGSVHPLLLNTPDLGERILEGVDDLDPSFRIWVLAKRQTIHDRLMRSLGAGLVAKDIAADVKTEIATAIANLDPTHEEACCHLMRVHAEQGDVAGALRIYKTLWDLLDRDYGREPALATDGRSSTPPRMVRRISVHRGRLTEALTGPSCQRLPRSKHRPKHASCCGPLRCMPSTAIILTSCRDSTNISRRLLCASANGAWSIATLSLAFANGAQSIVNLPMLRFLRQIRCFNTVSKPPPIRRVPKSTW